MPDWLAELPGADEEISTEGEGEAPDWLAELPLEEEDETPDWLREEAEEQPGDDDSGGPGGAAVAIGIAAGEEASAEGEGEAVALDKLGDGQDEVEVEVEEEGLPDWLAELPESETPVDEPSFDQQADILSPDEQASDAVASTSDTAGPVDESEPSEFDEDDLEIPDWLGKSSVDDLEMPAWLSDDTEEQPPPDQSASTSSDWMSDLRPGVSADFSDSDEEPDSPTRLEEGDDPSKKSEGGPSPDALDVEPSETAGGSPEAPTLSPSPIDNEVQDQSDRNISLAAAALGATTVAGASIAAAGSAATAAGSATTSKMTSWLDALESADSTGLEGEISAKTSEATGMFSGISALLPSEKVTIPSVVPAESVDSIANAARQFHAIATTPSQPAAIPKSINQQENLAASFVRSALYLLLLVLVALPLLPPLQKVVDADTGQRAPWTEPSQEFSDVLDNQRRQLISEQLGIIDTQPQNSVALVSFDYSTATQGEMQPLVDAVLGRLKGQGMRIIGVSLEPEGAPIAQQTFETIALERDENYGDSLVNLGFLPGQAAAVRRLATGQQPLANLPDYEIGTTINNQQNWLDVTDLRQVNMVVTFADNPATARWWIEQLQVAAPPDNGERSILAATSAVAEPFLSPYRESKQLDGLIAGISGAAAIEAGRRNFGAARQMIDSMSLAHLAIVILIAVGTIVGWMPSDDSPGPDATVAAVPAGSAANMGDGLSFRHGNENENSE